MEWKKVEMSPTWNRNDDSGNFVLKGGDAIEGAFVGVEEGVGPNDSRLYSIRTSEGVLSVWGSTVLDVRLKNVMVGEEVRIIYLGLVKSEKVKGRSYHNYEVYHRDKEDSSMEEPPLPEPENE